MRIRKARLKDFEELYKLGNSIQELKTSDDKGFLEPEDLKYFLTDEKSSFLVTEILFHTHSKIVGNKIVGFSLAVQEGPTYASLVYSAVDPAYRRRGIHSAMLKEQEKIMRERGVNSIYLLATNQDFVNVMKRFGYTEGKRLTWMYKDL